MVEYCIADQVRRGEQLALLQLLVSGSSQDLARKQ